MAKSIRAKMKVRIRTNRREAPATQAKYQVSIDARQAAIEAAPAAPPVEVAPIRAGNGGRQFDGEDESMAVEKTPKTKSQIKKALKAKIPLSKNTGKKLTIKGRYQNHGKNVRAAKKKNKRRVAS